MNRGLGGIATSGSTITSPDDHWKNSSQCRKLRQEVVREWCRWQLPRAAATKKPNGAGFLYNYCEGLLTWL